MKRVRGPEWIPTARGRRVLNAIMVASVIAWGLVVACAVLGIKP